MLKQGLDSLGLDTRPQTLARWEAFCTFLLEQNKVMNLTGATTREEVISRHLLDCAAAYAGEHLDGSQVIDVGCGAGFPSFPILLGTPSVQLTMLDAQAKRIAFLQQALVITGMQANAVHARAEEFAKTHREGFDIAVSRAVADLAILCELCLPLVRVGGRFLAMKSTQSDEEMKRAEGAITTLGGKLTRVKDYTIPRTDIRQRLICIEKVAPTPPAYPRRFAKIQAHPLGSTDK